MTPTPPVKQRKKKRLILQSIHESGRGKTIEVKMRNLLDGHVRRVPVGMGMPVAERLQLHLRSFTLSSRRSSSDFTPTPHHVRIQVLCVISSLIGRLSLVCQLRRHPSRFDSRERVEGKFEALRVSADYFDITSDPCTNLRRLTFDAVYIYVSLSTLRPSERR